MTTTLRPTEPLQLADDGTRSRRYQVCVNSRPVGAVHLATSPELGPAFAKIHALRIEEADRGRGRGTVAALAAEEVARGWGCRQIEVTVPGDAPRALGLTRALGYVLRNRAMEKALDGTVPALPPGSAERPMNRAEYEVWDRTGRQEYTEDWVKRGLPESEARTKADRDFGRALPQGPDTDGARLTVLEHEGVLVGELWLGHRDERAFVYDVAVREAHRGHGHGRTLMLLAEAQAAAAGFRRLALNVFAGNLPAERLYESLGYAVTEAHLYKDLL
ncbi:MULTISPECIES: GNAT family N-acetyltransferase [unclassified Streptomyces]|uniref:GNAT family N-acetyltransferase n=1 Tax=unclassified Streptomyces TaxID=2593676 RepID=UPI00225A64FD|nr:MULTISPECIES: GNAT family N-acetyltransferase [unclassified Streptomyces]MCX5282152.1 GNAT family N-acetyltransferase [Streptomyces sp. NBC_00198]